MSCFAIRDDDTSFFTRPEELDGVYGDYWGRIPISLAVVPFSVPEHRGHSFNPAYPGDVSVALEENQALVDWLREKVRLGHIEVMLHGYSHQYKQIGGHWVGEYGWKPAPQLAEETLRGKAYLETLLNTQIRVFVPPSNRISREGWEAVRQAGLNLSGIMGRWGDRPWSAEYFSAWLKRWGWRLKKGDAYPYPLSLGGIQELRGHALTPVADLSALSAQVGECARIQAPFVVATHYWEFPDHPAMKATLDQMVATAQEKGMRLVSVSHCFAADGH